ncbi:MAG: hypothetical protein MJY83_00800 [Bacteroidales bacterium]|nr:hypothetical protein [Bacteroidales bacterium]
MRTSGIYFDSSRFDEVVPCQLRCVEGLTLDEGEWVCARLRCRLRPSFFRKIMGQRDAYGLVFIGHTPPPADLMTFITPYLADGVCITLRCGDKKIPKRIAHCDPLGEFTVLYEA